MKKNKFKKKIISFQKFKIMKRRKKKKNKMIKKKKKMKKNVI